VGGKVFSLSLAAHNPDRGNERENMKVLDLFSGIGGFSIGLEKAGFETVAFCEIEEYPRAVLKRHWPNIPVYRDVRELTGEQLRADGIIPDVIVGGYPCQPFSLAGVRRGEEDDRHLWPEVRRIINEIRPTWCIFENVAGHITMGLDEVLSDLEAEGYAARPFVIPACGVDAPHRRDRVWIVAHANLSSDRRASRSNEEAYGEIPEWDNSRVADKSSEVCTTLAYSNRNDGRRERSTEPQGRDTRLEHGGSSERQPIGQSDEDVAYTSLQRLQGRTEEQVYGVGKISKQSKGGGTDKRKFWATEPNVGRVANGVSARSHRIKALGNAVVPQIPEVIGNIIMQIEGNND
jgi:DNA (cytosine-5)-methyltransferase 1